MIPAWSMSTNSIVVGVEAPGRDRLGFTFSMMTLPSARGVLDDLADGLLERPPDDHRAHLLVALELAAYRWTRRAEQRHAAARHDALLRPPRGSRSGVLHAGLLLLHLGLGRGADLDHRHAAGQRPAAPASFRGRSRWSSPRFWTRICLMRPSIALDLPAPSTIVVLSLVHDHLLGLPGSSSLMFSELDPRSSVIALPPVGVAMSSSEWPYGGRRSPAPFTAAHCSVRRSLFHDQGRQRLTTRCPRQ